MCEINLDATKWTSMSDFCDALLPALVAPAGHGRSVDAFIDSMIWGGMNAVEPPYVVRISATSALPDKVRQDLIVLRDCLADARKEFQEQEGRDVDVSMELLD